MTGRNKGMMVLAACLMATAAGAQQYRVQAALGAVPATGFYSIPVTPLLTAHAQTDLSDVRISDDSGRMVPYLVRRYRAGEQQVRFTAFPMLSQTTTDSVTLVELSNPLPGSIDAFSLVIANTAVARYASLSGSNDRQHWFIVDEHILLNRPEAGEGDHYVQPVPFPKSSYRYFRLAIYNAHTDPLHILQAGQYNRQAAPPESGALLNPTPRFTQTDSNNGISYVMIRQDAAYRSDQIRLRLSGPPFYRRAVHLELLIPDSAGRDETGFTGDYTISSGQPLVLSFAPARPRAFRLRIINGDNPPLRLESVQTEQAAEYLVAWLRGGQRYHLLADNPAARPPQYDLAHFNDSIPALLSSLAYDSLLQVAPVKAAPPVRPGINWIWIAIIAVVLLLGYMTYNMVGEMKGGE